MLAYTLPVPFDTSSIVASPASLSLSAVSNLLRGSTFSRDGDFLFVTDSDNIVYSFPLPTPWDITSNASSTSFASGLVDLFGIAFKPQGDKMYLIDIDADEIVEFDLSTIYDITTATANGNTIDLSPMDIFDLTFRSTGVEVFVITPIGLVTRLHLDEQWNISTASQFTNSVAAVDSQSIVWKPDGTKFFSLISSAADRIDESTMIANRWNQTNSVVTDTFSLAGIADIPRGIWVSPDGKICFIVDNSTDSLVRLNLSTGWLLSTISDPGISLSLTSLVPGLLNPTGVAFTKDQKTFYVTDSATDTVYQFTTAVPSDIVNAVYTGNFLVISGDTTDIQLKPDDRLMYISERTGAAHWNMD